MHLDSHIAGQRLARLRQRARSNALRDLRDRAPVTPWELPAAIEPTPATMEEEAESAALPERRKARRSVLQGSELLVRRIGGFGFQAGLRDVSTDGCSIELIEECVVGEDVIARFPQLQPLGAWVRWTRGPSAGIEFIRPIHPTVFKSLLTRLRASQASPA